ncbi:MAG TPA: TlpA disulfide reductase family protein [Chitinophaga sp.]|nr:TlpA disulfide reductase family protein [Chitinophaga sp.]
MIRLLKVTSLLLLTTGASFAQKAFQVQPTHPHAGETITISYNPDSTILKGLAPVTGTIYLYRNFDWEVQDLNMKMTDSGWSATYALPEDAALLSCTFSAAGKTDRGGRISHSWLLTAKDGRQEPGAFAGWGFLRSATIHNTVPDAVDSVALISDDITLFWINNELRDHPDSRRKIFYNAVALRKHTGSENADTIINRQIAYMMSLPDATEEELMDVAKAYRNLLKDWKQADSVENIIVQRYPNGITARDKWIYKMFRAGQEADTMWKEFVDRFPLKKFSNVETEMTDMYYQKVYRARVYSHVMKKNYNILNEMLEDAPLISLTEFERQLVVNQLGHNAVTPEFIFPYSQKIIDQIDRLSHQKSGPESKFYSPSGWEKYVLQVAKDAYAGHAALLNTMKQPQKALIYAEKVKDIHGIKNSEFNSLYSELLEKNGRHAEAIQVVENGVRENKATPEMIAMLKKEYIAKNKSDKGFDAYFEGMKSAEGLASQREHLNSQLIKLPAPAFKLEQMKGGYADLSKMKGKIVVLDFWATWCGPCKAALPGMQMAVDKYKTDDKVAFCFIATQETKPDYRNEIKAFIKEKQYTINVLYDGKNPQTRHLDDTYSKYARLLHISGIPQKLIIDQNGYIRWQSTGYMGSPSALVDEISYVIELLKKEN